MPRYCDSKDVTRLADDYVSCRSCREAPDESVRHVDGDETKSQLPQRYLSNSQFQLANH